MKCQYENTKLGHIQVITILIALHIGQNKNEIKVKNPLTISYLRYIIKIETIERGKMKYHIIRKCSVCKKSYGKTPTKLPEMHLKESHGFCPDCMRDFYKDDFPPEELETMVKELEKTLDKHI